MFERNSHENIGLCSRHVRRHCRKFECAVGDHDTEQCAIIKIITVVEVGEIIRKLTGPKTWMCRRRDQAAIRARKPGDLQQCIQASLTVRKAHSDRIKDYDSECSRLNFPYRVNRADLLGLLASRPRERCHPWRRGIGNRFL